jgi:hypothetical protein
MKIDASASSPTGRSLVIWPLRLPFRTDGGMRGEADQLVSSRRLAAERVDRHQPFEQR